jgi:hypothetical protein
MNKNYPIFTLSEGINHNDKPNQKKMIKKKLVSDLKIGDVIATSTGAKTVYHLTPYGTSNHSLVFHFEHDRKAYVEDKMTEFEILN